MKVLWTEPACSQLDGIYSYIAQSSEEYAKRMVDRITRKSQQIGEHPLSGRKVPEYDHEQIRETTERPYRIIYHILPDRIEILALIHGAQDF
ncbi:MAG: type II toxin-antitoxin system RelE/ParE family toxin [Planctomycetota bacterium]|jgi:plasmid stabilization system protein ParE